MPNQVGGSSSSQSAPAASSSSVPTASKKRAAEDHGDQDEAWRDVPAGADMDPSLVGDRRAEKRSELEDPPKREESKQQRIGDGPLDSLALM